MCFCMACHSQPCWLIDGWFSVKRRSVSHGSLCPCAHLKKYRVLKNTTGSEESTKRWHYEWGLGSCFPCRWLACSPVCRDLDCHRVALPPPQVRGVITLEHAWGGLPEGICRTPYGQVYSTSASRAGRAVAQSIHLHLWLILDQAFTLQSLKAEAQSLLCLPLWPNLAPALMSFNGLFLLFSHT